MRYLNIKRLDVPRDTIAAMKERAGPVLSHIALAHYQLQSPWLRVAQFSLGQSSNVTSVLCLRLAKRGLVIQKKVSARVALYCISKNGIAMLGPIPADLRDVLNRYSSEAELEIRRFPDAKCTPLERLSRTMKTNGTLNEAANALGIAPDLLRRCLNGRGRRDVRVRIAMIIGDKPSNIWTNSRSTSIEKDDAAYLKAVEGKNVWKEEKTLLEPDNTN